MCSFDDQSYYSWLAASLPTGTVLIDIVLPTNETKTLRLTQRGSAHTFYWSIHELQLFEHR